MSNGASEETVMQRPPPQPSKRPAWKRWLDWVFIDARPISAGFVQGCQEVVWGAWLLGWWDVWTSSTIYGAMGAVIPEDLAGSTLILLGVPKLLLPVMTEGSIEHRVLLLSLALGAVWWACVVVSCIEGNVYSTATNVYAGFGVASLWLLQLLRQDL